MLEGVVRKVTGEPELLLNDIQSPSTLDNQSNSTDSKQLSLPLSRDHNNVASNKNIVKILPPLERSAEDLNDIKVTYDKL